MSRVVVVPPTFGIATIKAERIDAVIANRIDVHGVGTSVRSARSGTFVDVSQREQYLVLWSGPQAPDRRLLSWHTVGELRDAIARLQQYLDQRVPDRKRKARDDLADGCPHRHLPAERRLLGGERASSVASISSAEGGYQSSSDHDHQDGRQHELVASYNGIVSRPRGTDDIVIDASGEADHLDTTQLPTAGMVAVSRSSSTRRGRDSVRAEFMRRLQTRAGDAPLTFVNTRDDTTPSLNFEFIDQSVLREGVYKMDAATLTGCSRCRPDMGQGYGCEYTKTCDCLEFAEVDPARLNEEQRIRYEQDKTDDSLGLPKRFPYHAPGGRRAGCLVDFYLRQRAPIYECNALCRCGPSCKNRCVQHGRRVGLEIFRTKNRGFGLRTKEALLRGQFIDTYRGEIISWDEAERREAESGGGMDSYQYALDKFTEGDPEELPKEQQPYVVDGTTLGGPTRFINHSCEPNCRQYTVSYNKWDTRVYELAFFASRDIVAGEELTFDYLDKDEEDADELGEEAEPRAVAPGGSQATESGKEKIECRCGARNCRRWLWM